MWKDINFKKGEELKEESIPIPPEVYVDLINSSVARRDLRIYEKSTTM